MELSRAQDVEAGDGTTTVVVVAGALLDAAEKLLSRGIHPTAVSESFQRAASHAVEVVFTFHPLVFGNFIVLDFDGNRHSHPVGQPRTVGQERFHFPKLESRFSTL